MSHACHSCHSDTAHGCVAHSDHSCTVHANYAHCCTPHSDHSCTVHSNYTHNCAPCPPHGCHSCVVHCDVAHTCSLHGCHSCLAHTCSPHTCSPHSCHTCHGCHSCVGHIDLSDPNYNYQINIPPYHRLSMIRSSLVFQSGVLYAVPLVIQNTQNVSTQPYLTVKITINQSTMSSLLASNLQNIDFEDGNGNVLLSWRESGTSNTGTDGVWWINLQNITVPANNSVTIYMCIYATSYNALNNTTTGVAPQLTSTYAQYDNGFAIFPWYENYAGTTLPSDLTPLGTPTVNNGITFAPSATGVGVYIYKTIYYILPNTISIIDGYYSSGTTASYIPVAFAVAKPSGTGAPQSVIYNGYYTIINGVGSSAFTLFKTVAGSVTSLASTTGSSGATQIQTTIWPYTGYEAGKDSVGPVSIVSSDSSFALPSITYLLFGNYGSGAAASVKFTWTRARYYPPNGVDPTVSAAQILLNIQ
jgi:hypothetical protein